VVSGDSTVGRAVPLTCQSPDRCERGLDSAGERARPPPMHLVPFVPPVSSRHGRLSSPSASNGPSVGNGVKGSWPLVTTTLCCSDRRLGRSASRILGGWGRPALGKRPSRISLARWSWEYLDLADASASVSRSSACSCRARSTKEAAHSMARARSSSPKLLRSSAALERISARVRSRESILSGLYYAIAGNVLRQAVVAAEGC
jgi:hypothetical protein